MKKIIIILVLTTSLKGTKTELLPVTNQPQQLQQITTKDTVKILGGTTIAGAIAIVLNFPFSLVGLIPVRIALHGLNEAEKVAYFNDSLKKNDFNKKSQITNL